MIKRFFSRLYQWYLYLWSNAELVLGAGWVIYGMVHRAPVPHVIYIQAGLALLVVSLVTRIGQHQANQRRYLYQRAGEHQETRISSLERQVNILEDGLRLIQTAKTPQDLAERIQDFNARYKRLNF